MAQWSMLMVPPMPMLRATGWGGVTMPQLLEQTERPTAMAS